MAIPSLLAVLAGQGASPMLLHLAKVAMPTPYMLGSMVEADFPGYVPSPIQFGARYVPGPEVANLEGSALFLCTGDADPPDSPGVWITAEPVEGFAGPVLMAIDPSFVVQLKRGSQAVNFRIVAPAAW